MKAGGGIGGAIRLEGAAELEKKLRSLDAKVANKISKKAVRAGAKVVLTKAKQLVPKKSKLLSKSLKVRAGKRRKGTIRVSVQTKDGFFQGETFYAAFVEFGHKAGSRKLASRTEVPAHPFLAPAFEQTKGEAVDVIIGVIRHGIFHL